MNYKKNNRMMYAIILIAMVIGVLAAMALYMQHTFTQERLQMVYSLKTIAEQDKKLVEAAIQSRISRLNACVYDYRDYKFSSSSQWKNIYRYNSGTGDNDFFALGVVTEDGKTFSSLDAKLDFENHSFVKEARHSGSSVQMININGYSSGSVFVTAVAPSADENSPVLFGLCASRSIGEVLSDSVSDMGGCVIACKTDGSIVMLSGDTVIADNKKAHDNFFDMMSHIVITGNDFQRMTYEISVGTAGAAYLNNGGRGAYCRYYPIKINSLTMVNIIPESSVARNFSTSESDMWSMVFIVSIFAGSAIICILAIRMSDNKAVQKINERIEESKRYAQQHLEMLNFVLKNSSTIIWEYDIARQSITIFRNNAQITVEDGPNYYVDNNYIHPEDIGKFLSFYSKINSGEPYVSEEIRIREKNDDPYYWSRIEGYTNYDDNNKPVKAMCASKDISAQKAIQQQYEDEVQMRQLTDPQLVFILRINLTTGLIEDKECNNSLFSDLLNFTTFAEVNTYITDRVVNDSERRRVKTELTSRHIIHLFDRGINNFETEYRRIIKGDVVHWIKLTITSMRSPTTDDILSFIYIRDINSSKVLELTTKATITDEYEYVACLDMPSDMIYAVKVDVEQGTEYQIEEERFSQRLIRLAAGELPMTDEQIEALSIDNMRRNLKDNDSFSYFIVVEQPDGSVRRKKVHCSYIDSEKGLVLLNRIDVTDVYEEEQRKNVRLTRALIEAEKAKKARGDFLAHMSHEIRTPLNGISGMLDIIKANPDENLSLYLEKAIISAKHLTGLINDILDMSKIDSGKMELDMAWVDIDDIRKYIDAIISPLAEEKQQHFDMHFNCNGYTGVFTDESRIKQIFINLLSNSVKYTSNGGNVSCLVSVVPCDDEDGVLMHAIVEDNGIGMSTKFLRHAFEPFVQAEKDFNRKGTGLGLAITKSMVEMMQGSINIESRVNKGTKISFDVKLKGRKEYLVDITASDMFMGRRAIVADDHDINLIIAQKMLTSFGLEAYCVSNGKEAVEMFQNSEEDFFDVVFMDMMMPVLDGVAAAKAIRQLDRKDAKTVEIIAMTANTFSEHKEELEQAEISGSLQKPYSREQLLLLLRKLFDDRQLTHPQDNITV